MFINFGLFSRRYDLIKGTMLINFWNFFLALGYFSRFLRIGIPLPMSTGGIYVGTYWVANKGQNLVNVSS